MALDFLNKSRKRGKQHELAPGRKDEDWPWKAHLYTRYLRETEGMTWPAISKETGIPESTLQYWSRTEAWKTKGEKTHEVQEWTRQRFVELAAANGMPKAKAMQLLVDGMTMPRNEITDDKGKVIISKPDYDTMHKYQKEYWKMTGMGNNAKGMEINNNAEGTVNIQVNLPEKQ